MVSTRSARKPRDSNKHLTHEDNTEQGATATSKLRDDLKQFQYSDKDKENRSPQRKAAKPSPSTKRKASTVDADQEVDAKHVSPASKKRKASTKYAPPAKYAHLSPLTDILEPGLIGVFVGFNPGVKTAETGHPYAHPSNSFWKLLHSSGCTDRRCSPSEAVDLPRLYSLGNTNLVDRPSANTAELSAEEQLASVPVLDAKIRRFKPEAVCIVGKSIWENIWKYKNGKKPSRTEFKYGWQDEKHNMGLVEGGDLKADEGSEDDTWQGAKVFVATSTSGLSASLKPAEKEAIWKPFGDWVNERRSERKTAS